VVGKVKTPGSFLKDSRRYRVLAARAPDAFTRQILEGLADAYEEHAVITDHEDRSARGHRDAD